MKKFYFSIALCSIAFIVAPCLSLHAASKTVTVDSHATIGKMLELAVSQDGKSEVKFGNIMPSAIDPTVAGPIKVMVDVKSNSGERYHLTQTIAGSLENNQGDKIAPENLRFTTSSLKTRGEVVTAPTPVSAGAQPIFTSDLEGRSDTVTAEYTLIVPAGQAPGNYSTLITYTVSTL